MKRHSGAEAIGGAGGTNRGKLFKAFVLANCFVHSYPYRPRKRRSPNRARSRENSSGSGRGRCGLGAKPLRERLCDSRTVSGEAANPASAAGEATEVCFFAFHAIVDSPNLPTNPVTDFPSPSPTKEPSAKTTGFSGPPVDTLRPRPVVPLKYLLTLFNPCRSRSVGPATVGLKTPTAWDQSGRVHRARGRIEPITERDASGFRNGGTLRRRRPEGGGGGPEPATDAPADPSGRPGPVRSSPSRGSAKAPRRETNERERAGRGRGREGGREGGDDSP